MNRIYYFFLFIVFFLVGCVSQSVKEHEHAPTLMISQNSDGEATLLWLSDTEYIYTVFFMDKNDGAWVKLRGSTKISGTGKTMMVKDRGNPNQLKRRYRLQFNKRGFKL